MAGQQKGRGGLPGALPAQGAHEFAGEAGGSDRDGVGVFTDEDEAAPVGLVGEMQILRTMPGAHVLLGPSLVTRPWAVLKVA